MEAAFSLLYTAKDFPEIYKSGPGRKPAAGERQELNDFLALLFDILNTLDVKSSGSTGYDRLSGRLETGDTVITLNYDTMLDSALVRRGWHPSVGYGLGGGTAKIRWKRHPGVAESCKARVLKLHGSLNWWVRGDASTLANVFSKKPVLVTAPRFNQPSHMIRQIIPPIYGKVFDHSHWRKLWNSAFIALTEAERWIVIGCSIVDTDYHLQALLRRSVKKRKGQNRRLSVTLVDRVKIRRRWQRILRGAGADYSSFKSFSDFLQNGLGV
jgi:hypothetical protein